jgi:hypothetical protein
MVWTTAARMVNTTAATPKRASVTGGNGGPSRS